MALLLSGGLRPAESAPAPPPAAHLVSWEGVVTHRTAAGVETAAREGLPLLDGETLRTGDRSRARLLFADQSIVTLGPRSSLSLAPSPPTARLPILQLLEGIFFFLGHERPRDVRIQVRDAVAGALGTEFQVVVTETAARFQVFDGALELVNPRGRVEVHTGEEGILEPGQAPYTRSLLQAQNLLQWWLYYPAVLDPDELELPPTDVARLASSLTAYRNGNLVAAASRWPRPLTEALDESSPETQLYQTALLLAVGEIAAAESQLATVPASHRLARALTTLIRAVRNSGPDASLPGSPDSASEWLAASYGRQAAHDLPGAREAAEHAVKRSPRFALARIRLAELRFGEGRIREAIQELGEALAAAPEHGQGWALRGYTEAAANRIPAARESFARALQVDPALGSAWMGRGLVRLRSGDRAGREDLRVAASLESNRALTRSYLGKSYGDAGLWESAWGELQRARELDPADPTSWLYEALVRYENREAGPAMRSLLGALDRMANRRLFRSQLLLDQDRAVGSANLAAVYADVGWSRAALREAIRAVHEHYGNFSAHRFLADSYAVHLDPRLVSLREEAAWGREQLLANLLAPVGAGSLSSQITQQEYSRLFERDGAHWSGATGYRSDLHQWTAAASQFGTFGRLSYAVDGGYQTESGQGGGEDLERRAVSVRLKHQIGISDHVMLEIGTSDFRAGDQFHYFDPARISPNSHWEERIDPSIVSGFVHSWNPEHQTLLLVGEILAYQRIVDDQRPSLILLRPVIQDTPRVVGLERVRIQDDDATRLRLFTSEAQHLWTLEEGNLVAGIAYQGGAFDNDNRMEKPQSRENPIPAARQSFKTPLERASAYAYGTRTLLPGLDVTLGVAADALRYPLNHRYAPLSPHTDSVSQLSPKAGLRWSPLPHGTLHAAYARSLGGVSLEQNYRLEPTLVGGINQAYRNLIPENLAGAEVAPTHDVFGVAFEQRLGNRAFFEVRFDELRSAEDQSVGAFVLENARAPYAGYEVSHRDVRFEEQSIAVSAEYLLADAWSTGASYAHHRAHQWYQTREVASDQAERSSTLDEWELFLRFFANSGWFGQVTAHAYLQNPDVDRRDGHWPDEFHVQLDLGAGYRFARHRAELRVALLNLLDQDYRLYPLNLYPALPRERAVAVGLRFTF